LLAVRFDAAGREVRGTPVPIAEGVSTILGTAAVSTASRGTVVYLVGGIGVAGAGAARSLVWVDRQGHEEPIPLPARTYTYPRLSPDGTKVAVDIRDQENDIWVADLTRLSLMRLTFDPANDFYPLWTPDGQRILFNSGATPGAGNLYWRRADGNGPLERLTDTTNGPHYPYSISPDGKLLVYQERDSRSGANVGLLFLDFTDAEHGKSTPRTQPLIHSAASEANAEISPNGHWLAYQSNESGSDEVWVRPFPNVGNGLWQVSTAGGTRPLWSRDGRELSTSMATGF
jgi:eukaryotic-like serine/threonine-protein kinase